jgi:hypothetical protein
MNELRDLVKEGNATPTQVKALAKRAIALKHRFVSETEEKEGVYLDPYFDLAAIDDDFEDTNAYADELEKAQGYLDHAIAETRALRRRLAERADAASYEQAIGCLKTLLEAEKDLKSDMPRIEPDRTRNRADGLIFKKMGCIDRWPPVFGENFLTTYGLLGDIDDELEDVMRAPGRKSFVLQAVRRAIGDVRELRAVIEEWAAGSPSPSPTHGSSPSVAPSSS